jgi:azurin
VAGAQGAPKILLDAPPRAIEYQLGRLSNAELVQVDRKPDDSRYRLVYYALLTRSGLGREYFNEALDALVALDKTSRPRVLLEGLSKVKPDDAATADRLLAVLLAEPQEALKGDRQAFAAAAGSASSPLVLRGAYGAMMRADNAPEPAWSLAAKREGHLVELLRSVPQLGAAPELRAALFAPVAALVKAAPDPATRVAAVAALGWTRQDAATFRIVAREATQGSDPDVRAAAVASLQALPKSAWPAGEVEPLARAIVTEAAKAPLDKRTEAPLLDAIQFAEKLADAEGLSDETRRALRRDLRSLGVQVVRIQAVPEQMMFDLRWFVVEAGKPVQIVLFNPDAMSHNLVVTTPGSLKEVGTAAAAMTPSTDPKVKPYVPDTPQVLQATRLLNWGETERLSFAAPEKPGEYPFVCTFPGHWVRMYGIMLVVPDREAWEANRTVPTDPMTGKPFTSQRD